MQKARFLPIPSDLPLSLGLGSGLKLASLPGNLRTAMPSPYAASIRGVYCPTDEETEAQPDSKSLLVTAAELDPSSDPCEAKHCALSLFSQHLFLVWAGGGVGGGEAFNTAAQLEARFSACRRKEGKVVSTI